MKVEPFLKDSVPTIQAGQLSQLEGLHLVDVRRPEEFTGELGHIPGSILKTLGPELDEYLRSEDRNKPILFICRSGARSANATLYAMELGYKSVYNLEGGMIDWRLKNRE